MVEPLPKPAPSNHGSMRVRSLGQRYPDAPVIFIYDRILQAIVDYSGEDQTRERGGFLIGGYHVTPQGRRAYVEIRQFIPALEATSCAASLTFTHEVWSQAHRQLQEEYPDDLIVGWQHTHPNLGVFLSGYDLFIHRHYFREDWQVAMVVDPCRRELGFFQWRGEELVDCGFCCVFPEGDPAAQTSRRAD